MRYILLCLLSLSLLGCAANPLSEVEITVTITESHPWREVAHKPLWKTVVYTDGDQLGRIHLEGDENSVTLAVKRDRPTIICAYPLSSLAPWGGYYSPGSERTVSLTQAQGELARLLLESWALNEQAFETLDLDLLFSSVLDATLVDQDQLLLSILDGSLSRESITYQQPLAVVLADIPQGRWVSELSDGTSFHFLWGDEIPLTVGGIIQRWINREQSLLLTLYADLGARRYTTTVSTAPWW